MSYRPTYVGHFYLVLERTIMPPGASLIQIVYLLFLQGRFLILN